jgi:hypothetical protein
LLDLQAPGTVRLEISLVVREEIAPLAGLRIAQMSRQRFRALQHFKRMPHERSAVSQSVDRDHRHHTDDDDTIADEAAIRRRRCFE